MTGNGGGNGDDQEQRKDGMAIHLGLPRGTWVCKTRISDYLIQIGKGGQQGLAH